MSRKEPKTHTQQQLTTPITPDWPEKDELHEEQLDQVVGGSQSTGAGAGKVTFNPFSITRKIDVSTPKLYE
jgi:type VI protein secretion system component Hcp